MDLSLPCLPTLDIPGFDSVATSVLDAFHGASQDKDKAVYLVGVACLGVASLKLSEVVLTRTAPALLTSVASVMFPLKPIRIALLNDKEKLDVVKGLEVVPSMPLNIPSRPGKLQCYDPATAEHIGEVDDMDAAQVEEVLHKAKVAQEKWASSSMATRKKFLRLLLEYSIQEMDTITRVSMRDSGKSKLGALLGEITPTAEKLRWLLEFGEGVLATEERGGQGLLTKHKSARVEYHPVGTLAVFAPFNYPYTNMMNHIASGVFAGNAVVCKVSEYTSWSADLYTRATRAALVECGADVSWGWGFHLVCL